MARESNPSARPPVPRMGSAQPLLFEVSWEVCQQVGGIYTVIRSKAPFMARHYGKGYCLVGPYNPETSPLEFEPVRPVGRIGQAVKVLQGRGYGVHFGRWLVTGQPQVVLLDWRSALGKLDEIKRDLWRHHDIGAPLGDALLDSVLAFGHLVQQFFTSLAGQARAARPIIAHFHEWMAASAIPELRRAKTPLAMAFTTHATLLGRYLAMHDLGFYDRLAGIDWLGEARRLNVEVPVRIERAAAHGAHLLTTVSRNTGEECGPLLGRRPDMLLPNGLNIERFVALHEFQNLHRQYKQRLHQFVMGHFFPSYTFDLDSTLYFFSAGRYEYRNKGFDLTLEALARLSMMLRAHRVERTVVFFLITRQPFRGINSEVLRRTAMLEELRRNCESVKDAFGEQLFKATARGVIPDCNLLVDDYWRLRLKRLLHSRRAAELPSIVTHDLVDDGRDEVLQQLRYLSLVNLPNDPVKVVYHPDFVSPSSPLLGLDYDQFVRGCHLGIFPSFYEPWGYTPMECVALGTPTVTSDLSGFGTYADELFEEPAERGVFVAQRRGRSFDQAAQQIADWLLSFCRLDRRDRIALRNRVESSADQFDWDVAGRHYLDAHRAALAQA